MWCIISFDFSWNSRLSTPHLLWMRNARYKWSLIIYVLINIWWNFWSERFKITSTYSLLHSHRSFPKYLFLDFGCICVFFTWFSLGLGRVTQLLRHQTGLIRDSGLWFHQTWVQCPVKVKLMNGPVFYHGIAL